MNFLHCYVDRKRMNDEMIKYIYKYLQVTNYSEICKIKLVLF